MLIFQRGVFIVFIVYVKSLKRLMKLFLGIRDLLNVYFADLCTPRAANLARWLAFH